jgi:AcrR family transcriptional regulator
MGTSERRERDRLQRHQLIIATARELAEQEGWEAVTTRRLAERVEYSQPVLYSHFTNKDAIVRAVAIEGFGELGGELRRARLAAPSAAAAVRAVAEAYLDFAATRPALYDAMFSMPTDIRFASGDLTPPSLRDAFAEFVEAIAPMAAGRDVEICAEVIWSALHGLATLTRRGRLPAHRYHDRLDVLLGQLASTGAEPPAGYSPTSAARPEVMRSSSA